MGIMCTLSTNLRVTKEASDVGLSQRKTTPRASTLRASQRQSWPIPLPFGTSSLSLEAFKAHVHLATAINENPLGPAPASAQPHTFFSLVLVLELVTWQEGEPSCGGQL